MAFTESQVYFPDAPCIEYLPTFEHFPQECSSQVGKYTSIMELEHLGLVNNLLMEKHHSRLAVSYAMASMRAACWRVDP